MRVPVYSLLEWIVRSILALIVIGTVGWTLYLDARTLLITSITGIRGPKGASGPPGIVGAKGPDGEIGPLGAAGPTGPLGITGPTGPFGDFGPPGSTGISGSTGLTGFPNPSVQGPLGYTGPTGSTVTGPTGVSIGRAGASGPTGSTGTHSASSLAITYGGDIVGLGTAITASFTPQHSLTLQYPILASYSFGPSVSNIGGNSPALIGVGLVYRISASIVATVATSLIGAVKSPMTCQIILTAQDDPAVPPNNFATDTVQIAPNQNVNTYSVTLRLTAMYPSVGVLLKSPTVLGFAATFQCSDLQAPSGRLVVAAATLTVVPIAK